MFDRFEPVMDRKDGRVLYWQPEPRDAVPPRYIMQTYGVLEWAGRKALA